VRANRVYELLLTRDAPGPAFLAGERRDRVEVVSVEDFEVVLFWELPARAAARRVRELRRDLAGLEEDVFLRRWERRGA
jgi:hypothetical protein